MPRLMPAFLRRRLERLRFPQLAVLTSLVFLATLLVPDPLPFVDEILLGLGTLLLASWKRRGETGTNTGQMSDTEDSSAGGRSNGP